MQNSNIGVDLETYLEMCEMLGEEPVEENMPIEFSELPNLIQQCFVMHRTLTDIWDTMNGNYLGKDYSIIFKLFDLYEIEQGERLFVLDILHTIDNIKSKNVADRIEQKRSTAK
jgi:hypothetical protein